MVFLVDANLPPVLATALAESGLTARHVSDLDLKTSSDSEIWDYALRSSAVIITKDEDFSHRCLRDSTSPIVIWLRFGNCRNVELLAIFMPLVPVLISRIEAGERLIEIR